MEAVDVPVAENPMDAEASGSTEVRPDANQLHAAPRGDENIAWDQNMDALIAWRKQKKEWPSQGADNAVESKLAFWMNKQRKAYKGALFTAGQVFR